MNRGAAGLDLGKVVLLDFTAKLRCLLFKNRQMLLRILPVGYFDASNNTESVKKCRSYEIRTVGTARQLES